MIRSGKKKRIVLLPGLVLCIGLLLGYMVPPEEASIPSTPEAMTAAPTAPPVPAVNYDVLPYTVEKVTFKDSGNPYASYSLTREMEVCSVGNRTYCFEKTISASDRSERIRTTEELFERLGIDPELRILLYTTLKDTYIENGSVYGRFERLTGTDYTAAVLLGTYGEFCNYGMVTGLARLLSGETPKDLDELPADWAYYDLNYLCFRPTFSSEEDVKLCEKLALRFAAEYVAEHGEAAYLVLLEKSGQPKEAEEARTALTAFYTAQSIDVTLSPILYAMGGVHYDYLAKCEYACNYLDKEWIDHVLTDAGLYAKTLLHENYAEVRDCFETLRTEMQQYQEYFNLYPYRDDLRVYFVGPIGQKPSFEAGGYYYEDFHRVFLRFLSGYSHEYIHSITCDRLKSPRSTWQTEGLANYYEAKFSRHCCETYNYLYDISNDPDNQWLNLLYEEYGRSFDMEKDWIDECGRLTYFYDEYYLEHGRSRYRANRRGYSAWTSFLDYLIRQFGEREVLEYLLDNHDLTTLTDLAIDELAAAWKEENETQFAGFPKYND